VSHQPRELIESLIFILKGVNSVSANLVDKLIQLIGRASDNIVGAAADNADDSVSNEIIDQIQGSQIDTI
jgi:hypothetical protein